MNVSLLLRHRALSFPTGLILAAALVSGAISFSAATAETVLVPGITLRPPTGSNIIGQDHTLTVEIRDQNEDPQSGVDVMFDVFFGPNAGMGGTETTGEDGTAQFTYTGVLFTGEDLALADSIRACFDPSPGDETLFCSVTVDHLWRKYGQYVCEQCGPGDHWIDTCSAGADIVDRDYAAFGIDVDFDINCFPDVDIRIEEQCGTLLVTRSDPRDDSINFPGTRPVDGHFDVIDTELITMCVTGAGLTLRAGFGQGVEALPHSYGTIAEDPDDPSVGISTFAVFFEVDMGDGTFLYNHSPLLLADSTLTCVPPNAVYAHLDVDCVPLYTDPNPGEGILMGNLVTASHGVPPPDPPTVCALDVQASGCIVEEVTVPIVMTDPRAMDGFNFDLTFDESVLTYVTAIPSAFMLDWDIIEIVPGPGTVHFSGTTTPPLLAADPDTLFYVVFETSALASGSTPLTTSNFSGDLLGGVLDCTGFVNFTGAGGTGDVNNDGVLTPDDARCAFEASLNFGEMPEDCLVGTGLEVCAADANCDGMITTDDACAIFCRFLCGGLPEPCFAAPGGPGPCPNGGGCDCTPDPATLPGAGIQREVVDLRLESSEILAGTVARIPVELRASGTLRAFMVDLAVPEQLEIVGLEHSDVTEGWTGFGEGHSRPGVVRLAGYDPEGVELTSGGWTTMGYLVVRAQSDVGSAGFELIAGYDQLEHVRLLAGEVGVVSDDLPTALALGAPRPNPSNGSVLVDFAIPAGSAQSVAIRVYNVEGRLVRTLVDGTREAGTHEVAWDGADETGRLVATGLYFFRMTTNTFEETRKVVRTK